MTTQPITLTADTFAADVLNSSVPAVVDFWAPWCGPCRIMNPIVSQIAEDYGDAIAVGKLNVDEANAIAQQYNISSIPTLIIFRDGEEIDRISGLATKETIVQRLNQLEIVGAIAV